MARIKVLDKHLAELIAAGEVVERPSSAIKELVENSIDAGASSVTVEIKNGGVSFIRVTDNGCGMSREDVPLAFLRHATSKISNQNDLDAITTLGFRGEALASISAVSRLEMLTKAYHEEIGTSYKCEGGENAEISDAGCPQGTTIIIRDLFFNTPARMKFLKKDVTEGNSVAGVMDKIALSHPEISVKFIRDGKQQLHSPGDGKLESAIYAVFGKSFSSGLIPVDHVSGSIKVSGFISLPTAARANRTMQNFFINGRFVKSRTAGVALDEAYKGSIMVGKFGACVLNLEMPPESVDVNVHPAKIEVRFINEKPVFDAVYGAVKNALKKDDKPKVMSFDNIPKFDIQETKPEQMKITGDSVNNTEIIIDSGKGKNNNFPVFNNITERSGVLRDSSPQISIPVIKKMQIPGLAEKLMGITTEDEKEKKPEEIISSETKIPETVNRADDSIEPQKPENFDRLGRYVGEAFNTYIIVQYGNDELRIIDKHAAHERIIYEELKAGKRDYQAQMLIEPIVVNIDKNEYSTVLDNLDILKEAGFEAEDFGTGMILVRSAPIAMSNLDVTEAFIEIVSHMHDNKVDISTDKLDFIYHNISCRAAMKGGDKRSEAELVAIAEKIENNPDLRYCPHGRPVSIILKKSDLEKQFGRIQ